MSIYRVVGTRNYQGFQPGEEFEANLSPPVEARAVRRGSLLVIARTKPKLQPGSYKLPRANG